MVTGFEAFLVHSLARSTSKLRGDIAEVGVFQGSTARLICDVKGDKRFRLFDTFAGLPASGPEDGGIHKENQYACSLESVREYLKEFDNLSFHQGLFPDSTHGLEEAEYSFVHLDVDLYGSTLDCLDYFYPRMVPGGILLSHDYSILVGVEQAFTEFLADKPEALIELPTSQCMIVKLPAFNIERPQTEVNADEMAAPRRGRCRTNSLAPHGEPAPRAGGHRDRAFEAVQPAVTAEVEIENASQSGS